MTGYSRKTWRFKGLMTVGVVLYLTLLYEFITWNRLLQSKMDTRNSINEFEGKFTKEFERKFAIERKLVVPETIMGGNKEGPANSTVRSKTDLKFPIERKLIITETIKGGSKEGPTSSTVRSKTNLTSSNHSNQRIHIFFTDKFSVIEEPVRSWMKAEQKFCNNRLSIFADHYALGKGVRMFPKRRSNYQEQAKGGEEIRFVLNQDLEKEEYRYQSDFWEMDCPENQEVINSNNFYWRKNIVLKQADSNDTRARNQNATISGKRFTIGVRRQDYANLHNWMRDIYNTFIVLLHFNIQPSDVDILFLDGHPFTSLDHAWGTIFSQPIRVGHLTEPVIYENFIWGLQENQGPITEPTKQNTVPYLEEFRQFVLSQYKLNSDNQLQCQRPQITFIIRRNAVYHPRNIEGKVGRKIFNEAETVEAVMKKFPYARVRTVLMESLPMVKQLRISSTTDIWIGMHGAGMSHIVFLPKHAAVLELFARNFKTGRPWFKCFHSITKWRNMAYDTWENTDSVLEMPHDFTIVPPDIITTKVEVLMNKICPNI